MKSFRLVPRFNKYTGKPSEPEKEFDGSYCDYCGRKIETDLQCSPVTSYQIHEIGGCETQYEDMELRVDGRTVDLFSLYENHPEFIYCMDWNNRISCEQWLLLEWMWTMWPNAVSKESASAIQETIKNLKLGEPIQSHNCILAHAMYEARHRVVRKLLGEKSTLVLGLEFLEAGEEFDQRYP